MEQTSGHSPEIRVGKTVLATNEKGKPTEVTVFTLTLGAETIRLFPLLNWGQLDVYKWRVQGKLPATPPGLEVAQDHVKIAGESVSVDDPDACAKLEKVLEEWLMMERINLEMARKKHQANPSSTTSEETKHSGPVQPHFQVQVDKGGQVHIHCWHGKELVCSIGLNLPGFQSLFSQGLMVKPRMLKAGVLHDWVELDGVLYSFEKGNNDANQLEKVLNERYLPAGDADSGKDIVIFANPASSTGFDIQFPVMLGGALTSRKRPLNEESLEVLQDADRCGVLQKGILIRLTRPSLIFKLKTLDGGESYLHRCPENTVTLQDETGKSKVIDLSQPVNCLRLSAVELTAIFNHPTIHKHGKASSTGLKQNPAPSDVTAAEALKLNPPQLSIFSPPEENPEDPPGLESSMPVISPEAKQTTVGEEFVDPGPCLVFPPAGSESKQNPVSPQMPEYPVVTPPAQLNIAPVAEPVSITPTPNSWLEPVFALPAIRYDWLACLLYERLAQYYGNSTQGQFGAKECWAIALSEQTDVSAPDFCGLFLTQKRGLGFMRYGRLACFHEGVVVIGTEETAIEGIGIHLGAVGVDAGERVIFVVKEEFRSKFGVPEHLVNAGLTQLESDGALILSQGEVLKSTNALAIIWTVPAAQEDPNAPQAIESLPPAE